MTGSLAEALVLSHLRAMPDARSHTAAQITRHLNRPVNRGVSGRVTVEWVTRVLDELVEDGAVEVQMPRGRQRVASYRLPSA